MNVGQSELLDRIKGGLFGLAIGDALGGTTEFMSPREIEAAYGYLTKIRGGGVWDLEPGEVTDDTMMTLCVAEGILEHPHAPTEAIGKRFLEWYGTNPKDIGNIIRRTFVNYDGDWLEAAFLTDQDMGQSGGNGSLMRCLPVAFAYSKLEEIDRVSRLQSKMTHYDDACSDACVIYNRIAFRLLRSEQLHAAIRAEVTGTPYEDMLTAEPDCPPSGYVVHTFRWVLYHLLQSGSFSEVVQRAANRGGDSDTIGAIAGGLAGIQCGYERLPREYTEAILLREQIDGLAVRLHELSMAK
jgi:ADP-ribosyl-[dinitrogen reductase] hydrolase